MVVCGVKSINTIISEGFWLPFQYEHFCNNDKGLGLDSVGDPKTSVM